MNPEQDNPFRRFWFLVAFFGAEAYAAEAFTFLEAWEMGSRRG
jgi:hypothetical protein